MFFNPVKKEMAPDYFDVVSKPMALTNIRERCEKVGCIRTSRMRASGMRLSAHRSLGRHSERRAVSSV